MTLTVTLELSPDVEAELRERIARREAEEVRRLLANALAPTVEALLQQGPPPLSDDEFEQVLDELANGVATYSPPGTPPLTEFAVSRESMYEDRG